MSRIAQFGTFGHLTVAVEFRVSEQLSLNLLHFAIKCVFVPRVQLRAIG